MMTAREKRAKPRGNRTPPPSTSDRHGNTRRGLANISRRLYRIHCMLSFLVFEEFDDAFESKFFLTKVVFFCAFISSLWSERRRIISSHNALNVAFNSSLKPQPREDVDGELDAFVRSSASRVIFCGFFI